MLKPQNLLTLARLCQYRTFSQKTFHHLNTMFNAYHTTISAPSKLWKYRKFTDSSDYKPPVCSQGAKTDYEKCSGKTPSSPPPCAQKSPRMDLEAKGAIPTPPPTQPCEKDSIPPKIEAPPSPPPKPCEKISPSPKIEAPPSPSPKPCEKTSPPPKIEAPPSPLPKPCEKISPPPKIESSPSPPPKPCEKVSSPPKAEAPPSSPPKPCEKISPPPSAPPKPCEKNPPTQKIEAPLCPPPQPCEKNPPPPKIEAQPSSLPQPCEKSSPPPKIDATPPPAPQPCEKKSPSPQSCNETKTETPIPEPPKCENQKPLENPCDSIPKNENLKPLEQIVEPSPPQIPPKCETKSLDSPCGSSKPKEAEASPPPPQPKDAESSAPRPICETLATPLPKCICGASKKQQPKHPPKGTCSASKSDVPTDSVTSQCEQNKSIKSEIPKMQANNGSSSQKSTNNENSKPDEHKCNCGPPPEKCPENSKLDDMPTIPLKEARRFMYDCLVAAGASPEHASLHADMMIFADSRGAFGYGMNLLEVTCNSLKNKKISGKDIPEVLNESPSIGYIDGKHALGAVIGCYCMDLAIKKAKICGIGFVNCKNATPFGYATFYSDRATKNGLIGMATSNQPPTVIPTRALEPTIGANPLAFSAPISLCDAANINFSTSVGSISKVEMFYKQKKQLPVGWAMADGKPMQDPEHVLDKGGLLPLGGHSEELGGHKGFCLGIMLEALTGILSGSDFGPKISKSKDFHFLSHTYMAINPELFASGYSERLKWFSHHIRNLQPSTAGKFVHMPGDMERKHADKVDIDGGIKYLKAQMGQCQRLADELKVKHLGEAKPNV